ncbi:MAG: TrmH family RNA methyltransferase, partial [Chlamydiota bacterium]
MYMELFSPHNSLIKHFCLLRDDKSYRQERGSFLIEGRKMLEEALARLPVKMVLATHKEFLPPGVEGKLITESLFKKVTGYVSPEGVLAEIGFSPQKALVNERYLLVLDNVQDPGNVGALIRAALALGWEAVILVGNCADPYGSKAISASKGAIFRLPIISMTPSALQKYCQDKIPLIAADVK